MRAYQLSRGGAGIEGLVLVERPDPKPAYRQVLIKVAACSLNYRDLAIARGTYRLPVTSNIIPLSDAAGEVIEIGAGVRRVKVGDKVNTGDLVCVLEAMKMQNSLPAPASGTVKAIHFEPGASVAKDAVILVIGK